MFEFCWRQFPFSKVTNSIGLEQCLKMNWSAAVNQLPNFTFKITQMSFVHCSQIALLFLKLAVRLSHSLAALLSEIRWNTTAHTNQNFSHWKHFDDKLPQSQKKNRRKKTNRHGFLEALTKKMKLRACQWIERIVTFNNSELTNERAISNDASRFFFASFNSYFRLVISLSQRQNAHACM